MLTAAKILLISTLFSSLLFGSYGKEVLRVTTIQSTTNGFKTTEKENYMVRNQTKSNKPKSNLENRENFNTTLSDPSMNSSDARNGTIEISDNLTTEFSGNLRSTSMLSTSSPLLSGFSKLPLNSSVAEKYSSPGSALPNATSIMSSDNVTSSFENKTMTVAENNATSVGTFSPASTTVSVTPLITEPDGWFSTTTESMVGFSPYPEIATQQPTSKFTNNSKTFPNGSDPQEDNRNTGVVFGTILGAILGASLLSLVGYLLCGKRKTDSFSHRRLYDDRNEPVLRLDNAPEPYDVSFGNSSYYNPNVNDSSMVTARENARDGIPMDDIPSLRTSV